MHVLILEDDPLISDLLKQVVLSLRPSAQIDCFVRVQPALQAWPLKPYALAIADWHLPDDTGQSFLEKVRQQDNAIPLVMITGRADRASVLAMRRLHINDFIGKPFQMPRLLECLGKLLPNEVESNSSQAQGEAQSFSQFLSTLAAEDLDIPLLSTVKQRLQMSLQGEQLDLRKLVSDWQKDPALVARLLAVANSSNYATPGKPCLKLTDALQRLGAAASLNLALALALRQASISGSPYLRLLLDDYLDEGQRLAEQVVSLAKKCSMEPSPLQNAALLHRIGELCVLFQAVAWESKGQSLDDTQVLQAIRDYSKSFAISLKAHWGLPMQLRELIGAVYALPQSQVHREQVVMRLAAAELAEEDEATLSRLRRLAGLI